MGRLFLLLMVVLGAALYFPESRERLINRVEPLLGPVLEPLHVSSTTEEMRQIARDLQEHERLYRRIPEDPTAFRSWMLDQYATETNYHDSWGRVYDYQLWPDSFAVRSDGPDGSPRTVDDLHVTRPRISRRDRRGR